MSMTKCGECGEEVSEKATVCPNCGVTYRTPTQPVRFSLKDITFEELLDFYTKSLLVWAVLSLPLAFLYMVIV